MSAPDLQAIRTALGPVGVFLPGPTEHVPPFEALRDAAIRLEAAGATTAWANEVVGGKDVLVQTALLLAATERLRFGTGIANMWARPPQTTHAAAAMLADAFPGRFVLGLGVGYAQQAEQVGREFGKPVETLRDYFTDMRLPTTPATAGTTYPRIVGAGGPRMLALATEHADGAFPAMQPPEFTQQARAALGPDRLLVVMARLPLPGEAGASVDELTEVLRAHLMAGADHVALGTALGTPFDVGIDRAVHVAEAFAAVDLR